MLCCIVKVARQGEILLLSPASDLCEVVRTDFNLKFRAFL